MPMHGHTSILAPSALPLACASVNSTMPCAAMGKDGGMATMDDVDNGGAFWVDAVPSKSEAWSV